MGVECGPAGLLRGSEPATAPLAAPIIGFGRNTDRALAESFLIAGKVQ
jgi:hypothetical protein